MWMYASQRPSEAIFPSRLAAVAWPFSRRILIAAASSPLVCSSARLQSIIPAPVFSRRSRTISAEIAIQSLLGVQAVGVRCSVFGLRLSEPNTEHRPPDVPLNIVLPGSPVFFGQLGLRGLLQFYVGVGVCD